MLTSLSKELLIEQLNSMLQRGWKRFQRSTEKKSCISYFNWLKRQGFYTSPLSKLFPHPAYDAAAREMGREFLALASREGISFADCCFPGAFWSSREVVSGKRHERVFRLKAYQGCTYFGEFVISFSHSHNGLDFPEPPTVKLM